MEELLGHPSVLSVGQSELHFSLGKAYEDLKDYEVSFQHYARGNDLVNKKSDFSLENTKSYFRLIRDSFSKEFIFENKILNHMMLHPFLSSECRDPGHH